LLGFGKANADTLTLQQAYDLAAKNYPNIKQQAVFDAATEMKLKNLTSKYFPQPSVNGQVTYQSDVVKFPDQFSSFLKVDVPKTHAQLYAELDQVIYDGGGVKAQKQLEQADHDVNVQNLQVDVYGVKSRVNSLFFTELVLQQKQEILYSNTHVLQVRVNQLNSAYKNGALLESEVLKLKAELLKVEQSTDENNASRKALTDALTVLLGQAITPATSFVVPSDLEMATQMVGPSGTPVDTGLAQIRPEYKLFDLQNHKLELAKKSVKVNNLPKLYAFGQAGVAYPNQFNFIDTKAKGYYLVGAKLSWNLGSWYTSGREKKLVSLQQQAVDIQQSNFQRNLDLAKANDNGEINRLKELVKKDNEIIQTYSRILQLSTSQLDNGTITTADYITDLNAETQARLNQQLHTVQLNQARANYITNQGLPNAQYK
jgi:outer membrane protein TolC